MEDGKWRVFWDFVSGTLAQIVGGLIVGVILGVLLVGQPSKETIPQGGNEIGLPLGAELAVAEVIAPSTKGPVLELSTLHDNRLAGPASYIENPSINIQAIRSERPVFDKFNGEKVGTRPALNFVIIRRADHKKGQFKIARLLDAEMEGSEVFEVREIGCAYRVDWSTANRPVRASLGAKNLPGTDDLLLMVAIVVAKADPGKDCSL